MIPGISISIGSAAGVDGAVASTVGISKPKSRETELPASVCAGESDEMSNDISPTGDISTDETSKLTPLSSAAGAVSNVISEDTFRVIPSFKVPATSCSALTPATSAIEPVALSVLSDGRLLKDPSDETGTVKDTGSTGTSSTLGASALSSGNSTNGAGEPILIGMIPGSSITISALGASFINSSNSGTKIEKLSLSSISICASASFLNCNL